jgi:hypothetical protein
VAVAVAAEMASNAPTLSFGGVFDPPLGNSANMIVSQNATRKRNRMLCPVVWPHCRRYQQGLKRRCAAPGAFCACSMEISHAF